MGRLDNGCPTTRAGLSLALNLPKLEKMMERYEHGTGVATYLANYLKGGPIGNKRLISDHNGEIAT